MFATVSQVTYLGLSVSMTVYVGWSLPNREVLADSVNHLLIVGFYLVNLGWILMWTRYGIYPQSAMDSINFVTTKLGVAMVALGGMHFLNLYVFWRIRNSSKLFSTTEAPPAVGFRA